MAKSIYETLESLTTETSVPGHGMVAHTLPAGLLPTDKQFESEADLLAWAQDAGIVHACLQRGVKQFIIDLRAQFKAVKKNETWSLVKGQAAVNSAEWAITKRPQGKKSAEDVAREYLAGLTPEQLAAFMKKA